MDVRQMRQILAIHEHGGFVKAAQELGISQPALSRSIARLEDQLRITLFERSRSGAVTTPLGLAIVDRASRLVTESERLTRDVELMAAGQIGEVRIGVGPSLRAHLPQLAVALTDRFPRLRISLNANSRAPLIEGLDTGSLDLIVIGEGADADEPEFHRIGIHPERLLAIGSPDHPLVGRADVTLDEFVVYPSISSFTTQAFTAMDVSLQLTRKSDPPPRYITNDWPTVLALMTKIPRVTHIGAAYVVEPWIRAGQVARIDLAWTWSLKLSVLMTRAATHSPVMVQCAELIAQVCRDLLEPGGPTHPSAGHT